MFIVLAVVKATNEKPARPATPKQSAIDSSKTPEPGATKTLTAGESRDNRSVPGTYPEGSLRYLTSEDLTGKSLWELRVMRNEIYARKGFVFKTAQLRSYFQSQRWYVPIDDNASVEKRLTPVEKANIALIKAQE